MNRYQLSREAEQDLEDIWVYLAEQDEIGADRAIAKLLDHLPMLAQFPEMGKLRDELLAELRSFPVKPYIVFYFVQANCIEIVRILHGSRDVERLFDQ